MTDAKKYLQQIRLLDVRINTKLEEVQHLKDMLCRITPTLKPDTGSGGGTSDKLGDAVARIVDLEREINAAIDKYADEKTAVSSMLDKLNDPDQLAVLHGRYVQYKSFEQISIDMSMTYRNICYIHGKGLQAVNEIMKGEDHAKN